MRHFSLFLAILPVLVGGVIGCDGQVSPQAQKMFDSGRDAYIAGDDAKAVQNLDLFLVGNEKSRLADEAYYYRGLSHFRQKDMIAARMDFNQVISITKRSDLKAQAMKALGDLAFEGNDMATAESMYSQAMTILPGDKQPADEIRYRLGQTYQRQGRWDDANLQFNRLIQTFPPSEITRRAGRIVNCNTWTIQVAAFDKKAAADTDIAQLKGKGIPAFSRMYQDERGPRFAVQTGRYASYDEAAAFLRHVKTIRADAYVTPTR